MIELIREIALKLPEVAELPHFEKTSFRVAKKIFATVDEPGKLLNVKLSMIDQDVFSAMKRGQIYPVPNKWGKQGWTIVELKEAGKDMLTDVLLCAYTEVAPRKLSALINR